MKTTTTWLTLGPHSRSALDASGPDAPAGSAPASLRRTGHSGPCRGAEIIPGPSPVPSAGPGVGRAGTALRRPGQARKRGAVSLRRRRGAGRPLLAAVLRAGGGAGAGGGARPLGAERGRGAAGVSCRCSPARPCAVGWEWGEEGTRRRRKWRRLRIAGKWGAERLQQHRGRTAAAAATAAGSVPVRAEAARERGGAARRVPLGGQRRRHACGAGRCGAGSGREGGSGFPAGKRHRPCPAR